MPPSNSTPETPSDAAAKPAGAYRIDRRRRGWNEARCSICQHPKRAQIELALARGASRRSVAEQYDCNDQAARRHFERHVPPNVKASLLAKYLKPTATIEAILAEETPGLIERLAAYRAGAWHLFNLAVETGDRTGASPIMRELVRVEELIAQQTGELRARASAPVQHLHLTADFLRLRQSIMLALRPYPEALAAVAHALRMDGGAATPDPALIAIGTGQ
jgi:hypothetical protein